MSEARKSRGQKKAQIPTYVARMCWNTAGWVQPSGDAARAESNTYVADHAYGHEEWLFNFAWALDGWQYAFLQPVNRSHDRVQGQVLNILVYTISPSREWFYVSELKNCEVIDEPTAEAARREYKRRGWLKMMEAHVRRVDGKVEGVRYKEALSLFNIRFRPADGRPYDPMVPVGQRDAIRDLRRYNLVRVDDRPGRVLEHWRTRVGTSQFGATGKVLRGGTDARQVTLLHEQLKKELHKRLTKRFGLRAVTMEEGFVDVRVEHRGRTTLYEVKSDPRPRFAIREALGQVLEYAYRAKKEGRRVHELVIAAPGEPDKEDRMYIDHLRKHRGLPLRYLCLRYGAAAGDV